MDLIKSWRAWSYGFHFSMFKIKDFNEYRGGSAFSTYDFDYESCKKWFDSRTHESMTRERIKDKDAFKMMRPARIILGCLTLTVFKKGIDKAIV